MSWPSRACSSGSPRPATAASRAREKRRPITAPICASSLAGPSRSSRLVSEACSVVGMRCGGREGGDSARAAVSPASTTALVSSSMNKRHAVGPLEDLVDHVGRQAVAAEPSDEFAAGGAAEAVQGQRVDLLVADPGRIEVGPEGHQQQDRELRHPLDARSSSSRLVGSIQCTSSKIATIGRRRDGASTSRHRASSVFCLRCCGGRSSRGYRRSSAGQGEQLGDQRGVLGRQRAYDSRTCSLSSFAARPSSRWKRAARSSWAITGWSALSV